MIIVVAVTFLVSWTPFYLVIFVSQVQENSFLKQANFLFTMLATNMMGFLNSCINPFIYNCMSEKFRKSFVKIMASLCFCCCPKGFIQHSSSIKSHGDSTEDNDGSRHPAVQPSYSNYQRSSLIVQFRGKEKSPNTVLIKMSPLGNINTHKQNGNSQCIFKYSPLSLRKATTESEKEYFPIRQIKMHSLKQNNTTESKVCNGKDGLPVDILHNHD